MPRKKTPEGKPLDHNTLVNREKYAALLETENNYKELLGAARLVVDRWSEGDLADAVNQLGGLLPEEE